MGSFDNKKLNNPSNQNVQGSLSHQSVGGGPTVLDPTSSPGVSKCYVFKSQLQEYAQKVGLPTPVYETVKEGPSHEPSFMSTVIVNGDRYDSLPGFFNRKAAEQSAAEIALRELSKCGEKNESISVPVHETGLCKNLLQEYAQKMNYAIPTYICRKDDAPGRTPLFSCTVEIGGIQYIGATAKTKKEAEIKAARTALLAIRSNPSVAGQDYSARYQYTVVPCKRKVSETASSQTETVKPKKSKKPRFKKKKFKQNQAENTGVLVENDMGTQFAVEQIQNGESDVQVPDYEQTPFASSTQDNGSSNIIQLTGEGSPTPHVGVTYAFTQLAASSSEQCARNDGSAGQLTDGNIDPVVSNEPPPVFGDLNASDLEFGIGLPEPSPVSNDPPVSAQLNTLVSESGIAEPSPVIKDPPVSGKLNTLVSESGIALAEPSTVINYPPVSGQLDTLVSESGVCLADPSPVISDGQAVPSPVVADSNHDRLEDHTVANGP